PFGVYPSLLGVPAYVRKRFFLISSFLAARISFFFNCTATTEIYTLSLHDALPIYGVTSVVAGNCGYSIAPCRPADRAWLTEFFAKVEGMSPSVLRSGLPWDWETFPSLLEVLDRRLGINAAIYIGHSALRRYVMGDAASE